MNVRTLTTFLTGCLFAVVALTSMTVAQDTTRKQLPKFFGLDPNAAAPVQILNGPPETVSMRSGYMVIPPSKSVGIHSTKGNEETIVVLAGTGELRITGKPAIALRGYSVAYCPPNTEHNVVNTGSDTLRYVYVVARASDYTPPTIDR